MAWPFAIIGSVAIAALASLVAWRWWLTFRERASLRNHAELAKSLADLPQQHTELERRVKALEYKR